LSFKDPTQSLRDILESAQMIEDFTVGMSFEQFRADRTTVAAVERKFQVIGEAAVRPGREAPLVAADVPWRQIRDLGNLLRHACDEVDPEIIWQTITDELPPQKAAVLRVLQPTPGNPNAAGWGSPATEQAPRDFWVTRYTALENNGLLPQRRRVPAVTRVGNEHRKPQPIDSELVEAGELSFSAVLKIRNLLILRLAWLRELRVLRGRWGRCHDLSRFEIIPLASMCGQNRVRCPQSSQTPHRRKREAK
jgi:uncharacterized protein with HEPN domain